MMVSKLEKVMRHPSLLLHAYKREPELARIHTQIHLEKAEAFYSQFARNWDPTGIISAFRKENPCYHMAYLYAFCRHFRPETVVETGVHYGASSAFILKALEANIKGHLYSIDLPDVAYVRDNLQIHHDALPIKGSTGFVVPSELQRNWTLIIGDSKIELPQLLSELEGIDLFHHDSKHTYEHMMFEFETVWPKLREGGVLMSDDVTWNSAFRDFCTQKAVEPQVIGERVSG